MFSISKQYGIRGGMAETNGEAEDLKTKLIYLPQTVLDGLLTDARRCKRSLVKHIEAILTAYLELEDIELRDISSLRATIRKSGTSEPPQRSTEDQQVDMMVMEIEEGGVVEQAQDQPDRKPRPRRRNSK